MYEKCEYHEIEIILGVSVLAAIYKLYLFKLKYSIFKIFHFAF